MGLQECTEQYGNLVISRSGGRRKTIRRRYRSILLRRWLCGGRCNCKSLTARPGQLQPPIQKHHPIVRTCAPQITRLASILVPPLAPPEQDTASHREDFEEYAVDISEWLGLLALNSSRVQAFDSIDPYLSHYEVPYRPEAEEMNLVSIRWRGLLSAKWITRLFLECM